MIEIFKILHEKTPSTKEDLIIINKRNNKQKLQILEALHIRNMQPTLNRINFQTGANVLKCF